MGRLFEGVSAIPVAKLRYFMLIVLVVWFLSLLADLVWMLVPVPVQNTNNIQAISIAPNSSSSRPAINIQQMQSWYLFGASSLQANNNEFQQIADDIPDDVALTDLQLVLLGILLSDVPEESFAIIQTPSKTELFQVGSELPVGNGIALARVLVDRVIINNRGKMESLLLYAENKNQRQIDTANSTQSRVVDQRNNSEISQMASEYRNQLLSNPMSLADVIKVSIAKDSQGNLMGYRIRPGRDRSLFAQFGLQTGDIVTAINGVSLDDPAKAMELYGQLREAKEASFVVKRGGEEVNIIVGLNQ